MKLPLALAALLFAAGLTRADIVIVQKVNGAGQDGEMTVKVSKDKVRADVSPLVSTITDAATGDTVTLMHAQKCYIVISAAASRVMIDQMTKVMQQSGSAPAASPAAPKATGRTDKINGYNAAEYTFSNGNIKATYWVAPDFPNAKDVSDAFAKFQKGSLADMTKAFAPDVRTLPGVPIRTEVEINGQKVVTEIESVKEEPVDPTEYQVPAAYTEMKLPAAPAQ